jgi:hypothetical protein
VTRSLSMGARPASWVQSKFSACLASTRR